MRLLPAMTLALAVCITGCSGPQNGSEGSNPKSTITDQQTLIITPSKVLAGRVIRFNEAGRFVVLSFPVGRLPALEQRLNLYRGGLKTGEVRISGPQYDDKIVADLISGTADVGDEARDQ